MQINGIFRQLQDLRNDRHSIASVKQALIIKLLDNDLILLSLRNAVIPHDLITSLVDGSVEEIVDISGKVFTDISKAIRAYRHVQGDCRLSVGVHSQILYLPTLWGS